MSVVKINGSQWQQEVKEHNGKVLVDIWGTGCAPCETFAPVLESFAQNTDTVKAVKMNFDDGVDIAIELGLRGLPTLYLFENGELIKEHTGIMNEQDLSAWVL